MFAEETILRPYPYPGRDTPEAPQLRPSYHRTPRMPGGGASGATVGEAAHPTGNWQDREPEIPAGTGLPDRPARRFARLWINDFPWRSPTSTGSGSYQ
jgi:hypothetical protein